MDPEQEDKTQEAIDLYFSRHHKVTSPEDSVPISVSSLHQRSILMESVGNSPNLSAPEVSNVQDAPMEHEKSNTSKTSSCDIDGQINSSTQTCMSFPPILPPEIEKVLAKYGIQDHDASSNSGRVLYASATGWSRRNTSRGEDGNLSNSTLRRKLFAGLIADSDEGASDDENLEILNNDDKENCESTAMIMSPGKVCFTPNAQRLPSPNKSLSWSLSPVSRKKRSSGPVGASTPTRRS